MVFPPNRSHECKPYNLLPNLLFYYYVNLPSGQRPNIKAYYSGNYFHIFILGALLVNSCTSAGAYIKP